MATVDQEVYINTGSSVHKINTSDGQSTWSYSMDSGGTETVLDFTTNSEYVFTNSGNSLHKLDRATGNKEFTTSRDQGVLIPSTITASGYVLCRDYGRTSTIRAVDVQTGRIAWQLSDPVDDGITDIEAANGTAYIGTSDNLYTVDSSSGDGFTKISDFPSTDMHISADESWLYYTIFAGFEAMKIGSSESSWSVDRLSTVKRSIYRPDNSVYVLTDIGIVKIDTDAQRIGWRQSLPAEPKGIFDVGSVGAWIPLDTGVLVLVDSSSGDILTEQQVSDGELRLFGVSGDVVLVGDGTGISGYEVATNTA
jgi:hypothetical protein